MREIHSGVYVGDQNDFEHTVRLKQGWFVVHACKEPYHRKLLGYTGRGAPKGHPEYLLAKRSNALFLNLIDADDPRYIPKEIIDVSLRQIFRQSKIGKNVLIHCNQGESRSPTIGLLYLCGIGIYSEDNYTTARKRFTKIYSKFNPAKGMDLFARKHWNSYQGYLKRFA